MNSVQILYTTFAQPFRSGIYPVRPFLKLYYHFCDRPEKPARNNWFINMPIDLYNSPILTLILI